VPIRHKLRRVSPPNAAELTRLLMQEWTNPQPSGQPLIVIEDEGGQPRHVYVIWDEWGDLSQVDRSMIIMDVVENLTGERRISDPSQVTVAMGLTSEEARRMGLEAA